MSARIGEKRMPEFMRHYFNSVSTYTKKAQLFRTVRQRVSDAPQALELIVELERAAVCYTALRDADDDFWLDYAGAEEHVRALITFAVTQFKPLALSAVRRLSPQDVVTVLRDCVVVSFRFNIIGSRGAQALEQAYNKTAIGIDSGELRTPAEIRAMLASVYIDDDTFRTEFASYTIGGSTRGRKLWKYILCTIEESKGRDISWHSAKATIEHILPESLNAEWRKHFSDEQHAQFVSRLGNLALLEKGKNKDAARRSFDKKRTLYCDSDYVTTQEVDQFNEWNPAAVTSRQKSMARVATSIWRFP